MVGEEGRKGTERDPESLELPLQGKAHTTLLLKDRAAVLNVLRVGKGLGFMTSKLFS